MATATALHVEAHVYLEPVNKDKKQCLAHPCGIYSHTDPSSSATIVRRLDVRGPRRTVTCHVESVTLG